MKVSVRSIPDSFFRAGLKFTKEPQVIDVDADTYELLKAEKNLVVEKVEPVVIAPIRRKLK